MNDDDEGTGWREATLTMALEEHFGRRPPDVAARLHRRAPDRTAPETAPRTLAPRLAAAALMVLGAGIVLAVGWTARDPVPAQGRDECLLPLTAGNTWIYDVARGGDRRELTRRTLGCARLRIGDGEHTVHQVLVVDGEDSGLEHWSVDAGGVQRHAGVLARALPDPAGAAPTRIAALPLGTEAAWPTTAPEQRTIELVRAGNAGGGRNERVVRDKRGELVAPAESVDVPAGRFTAVHVRLAPAAAAKDDRTVEHFWFARGVGIVRSTREIDGAEVERAELRTFTAGPPAVDPQQVLATFLAKNAAVTSFGPVQGTTWLEPTPREVLFASRFAVVTFLDRKVAYRVRGSTVAEFDADDTASWDALLQDEGMTGWVDALLPQMRCTALADAMLRLRALRQGQSLDGTECRTTSVRIDAQLASCARTLQVRASDGERILRVEVDVGSDDRVRRMDFRE